GRGWWLCGCSGGGKSRLRGVEAELQGGLVSGLTEVSEQVTDALLGGVDDLAGGSLVDGVGDVVTQSLEAAPQEGEKGLGGALRLGFHQFPEKAKGGGWSGCAVSVRVCASRKICHALRERVRWRLAWASRAFLPLGAVVIVTHCH